MRSPGSAKSRQLSRMLEEALTTEAQFWKVPVFKNGCIQGTDISPYQQQDVILWLGEMSKQFHFCPETFALGVSIFSRLLSTVKAQAKYLKCIGFTSLILAAKINEEDEVIGSVKDLVVQSRCNFSTAEILRMERTILDKLHWDLYIATPVDFIHIFHALLISSHPHLIPSIGLGSGVGLGVGVEGDLDSSGACHQKRPPGLQVVLWTRQVQHCMASHQLWQFKGSTLALAIITLELEALTPDWFSIFTDLLRKAQVESAEFIHCKGMVDEHLRSQEFSLQANAIYIFNSTQICEDQKTQGPMNCSRWARTGRRRGSGSDSDRDLDEYYDGFSSLYREETILDVEENGGEDLCKTKESNISPCPPLNPPVSQGPNTLSNPLNF